MRGGRTLIAAISTATLLGLAGTPASAQGPAVPTTILGAHLYPKPYGNTYVYGRVEVPATQPPSAVAGQTVVLYSSVFPFTTWTPVSTMTTDFEGYFSYHTTLGQNTTYRAIWQSANPPIQSKDRLVKVPLKLSLKASHARVKKKGVVTFTGSGRPAHPGAKLELQQLDKHGRFKTVASTTASPTSEFSVRTRLRSGGVFRVLFPGDGQFGIAASRPVRVQTR
jgi:hypothetical protein